MLLRVLWVGCDSLSSFLVGFEVCKSKCELLKGRTFAFVWHVHVVKHGRVEGIPEQLCTHLPHTWATSPMVVSTTLTPGDQLQ